MIASTPINRQFRCCCQLIPCKFHWFYYKTKSGCFSNEWKLIQVQTGCNLWWKKCSSGVCRVLSFAEKATRGKCRTFSPVTRRRFALWTCVSQSRASFGKLLWPTRWNLRPMCSRHLTAPVQEVNRASNIPSLFGWWALMTEPTSQRCAVRSPRRKKQHSQCVRVVTGTTGVNQVIPLHIESNLNFAAVDTTLNDYAPKLALLWEVGSLSRNTWARRYRENTSRLSCSCQLKIEPQTFLHVWSKWIPCLKQECKFQCAVENTFTWKSRVFVTKWKLFRNMFYLARKHECVRKEFRMSNSANLGSFLWRKVCSFFSLFRLKTSNWMDVDEHTKETPANTNFVYCGGFLARCAQVKSRMCKGADMPVLGTPPAMRYPLLVCAPNHPLCTFTPEIDINKL